EGNPQEAASGPGLLAPLALLIASSFSLLQAERGHHDNEAAAVGTDTRHSFKIVHGPRFNPSDRAPEERAGHLSISREPKLKECIADVVIAEKQPGIVDRSDFGSVVGLRAGTLAEGDRLDARGFLRLLFPLISRRKSAHLLPCISA